MKFSSSSFVLFSTFYGLICCSIFQTVLGQGPSDGVRKTPHRRRTTTRAPRPQPYRPRNQAFIGIQGAAIQKGQPQAGVDMGPDFIRDSGFINNLRVEGHNIRDYGNIDFGFENNDPAAQNRPTVDVVNAAEVSNATFLISQQTARILREGRFPLTLGGDHSLVIGTIQGVSQVYPDFGVLYIDAHSDIDTPATTNNGNLHGMPMSLVVQELAKDVKNLTEFSWRTPRLPAANLAYIGLRYFDRGEHEIRRRLGIEDWNLRDVDRLGIKEVTRLALNRITIEGGLSLREAMTMLFQIQKEANIIGFELTEVNPSLGEERGRRRTSVVVRQLLGCVFGTVACQGGINNGI